MSSDLSPDHLTAAELLLAPELLMLRTGPVADYAVMIKGGKFTDVGTLAAVRSRHSDLAPVALPGKLLMPGFVDAHHHLTQTFGKALAFGEPSEIFRRIWVPLEGVLDDELVYLTAKAAVLESLRGGFTTVVDAGTRAEGNVAAIARGAQEAGLRCVLGLICNDLGAGGTVADRDAILKRAEDHLKHWRHDDLIHPSLAISIPEAATAGMLREVSALAARSGAVFQSHVNEHLAAVERSLMQLNRRPLEHLYDLGALGPHVLIAHSTLVTPTELAMLKETDTAIAYNPVASQWKGNAVAPATLMATLGIRFGIGTDGTRSDGFRLVDAAEATQRIAFGLATGDFSCGGGWTWLEHATSGGAEVSGLGSVTGEIATGLAADCLLVDIDVPEFSPSWDLTWELVRLGNRDQIVAVFVAGRLRLWRGWPVEWDGRALMHEITQRARNAVGRAPIQRIHPVSSVHRAAAKREEPGKFGSPSKHS
jgi:5-methylthioadenosine/S-adenosylhomocysteine deaminase